MSRKDDPYEVLGVRPSAPEEVIRAAYKALSRKHHTDTTGDIDDKEMRRAVSP